MTIVHLLLIGNLLNEILCIIYSLLMQGMDNVESFNLFLSSCPFCANSNVIHFLG